MSLDSATGYTTTDQQMHCNDAELSCFAFGPFIVHVSERRVTREGRAVKLGGRAFDILIALAQRAGQIVSKRDLIKYAWSDRVVEESSLRVNVVALRRALADGRDGARYIINVAGRGYCLIAPVVRRLGAADAAAPGAYTRVMEREGFVVLDPMTLKRAKIDTSSRVGATIIVGSVAIVIVFDPAGGAPCIDLSNAVRSGSL